MKQFRKYETDVLIIGNGIAGLSLSILLKKKGVDSFILGKGDTVDFKIGESIHPSAKRSFNCLNLTEEEVQAVSVPLLGHRSKWGSDLLSERNFFYEMYGSGFQIDRLKFESLLSDKSQKLGIHKLYSTNESFSIECQRDYCEVTLCKSKAVVKTKKIVDCTGRRRLLKGMWNQDIEKFDSLICAFAVFQKESIDERDYFTIVESLENSWIYSGHLPENKIVVCAFTDPRFIVKHKKDKNSFLLASVSDSIYTKIRLRKSEQKFVEQLCSASSYLAKCPSIKNIFTHGDSAYTLDPLASFGIQKCFEDSDFLSTLLSREIKENVNCSLDYNNYVNSKYKQYLKERKAVYSQELKWSDTEFWKTRVDMLQSPIR